MHRQPLIATTLVLFFTAPSFVFADARSLAETNLFSSIAQGCSVVDLSTWQHPVRSVLLKNKVVIEQIQLCNGSKYPVFHVRFPYDPQGQTKSYFSPLYDQMRKANGKNSFSFVAVSDNTVVSVSYRQTGQTTIEYEMYKP